MNPIAIIIPTLDAQRAAVTGKQALATAGCPARLIVVAGPARGFTQTVNEGLAQLEPGEDVCILNDDVTGFQYSWLALLQQALYKQPRYGIAGPSGKSATKPACYGAPGMRGLEVCAQLSFWCVLLKRAMLDAIGKLDARFIHYCSDNEYCARAARARWQCVWVRGVYLEHTHHGSGRRREWWAHDRALWAKVKRG